MPILVTNDPISNFGGIQRYVARLACALAERGERVVVIEPESKSQTVWPNVRIVPYAKKKSHIRSLVNALWAFVRESRKLTSDWAITSTWFPSGFMVALIPRGFRGPLAVMAHGLEIAPGRRGIRQTLMRWTFARADVVFALSRYTQYLLNSAGVRARTVIIPCGADPKPCLRRPSPEPRLITVGRLVARKGFDRTIAAMPMVLAEIPNARLRIVGDGPQRGALEVLAKQIGVEANVDFLGPLDDDAVEVEYSQAWCFSMPSRRIGDDVEGFGIVYLEAAMAGLPCIGGIDSGAADAIADEETGKLVDGNDSAAIARAIIWYLSDLERSTEVGARGRDRVLSSFTWGHNADAVAAALKANSSRTLVGQMPK